MEIKSTSLHVEVHAPICSAAAEILTTDALCFIGHLSNKFEDRRRALLSARQSRSMEYDSGGTPHFLTTATAASGASTTTHYRREPHSHASSATHWKCAPIPLNVRDRRVEITGPVDRKMVINGLNSGANVYMADFEDSTSPTWSNLTEGQRNLRDAVRGTITYTNPTNGKVYAVRTDGNAAVLMVRPRGWHLDEAHATCNGRVVSGSLFDFGLFFYHNVHTLIRNGGGAYFYLPKVEHYLEARLWNDVFLAAQDYLGVPRGTIRATVLLETITAAFEMEEILYELRHHSLGLNCGRWDYLFSYIKNFKNHPNKITPDRQFLTMQSPLMKAYVTRLIHVCHKRGTFAMGGMAAQIPIKNDPDANARAMARIERDKVREVTAGHDGTWVAHPALVPLAKAVFDNYMPGPNQIDRAMAPEGAKVTEAQLLELPVVDEAVAVTTEGLTKGIAIVLAYTEAWLRGVGCIPLNHHMEDAATAEISRAQIWQWKNHQVVTRDNGLVITPDRIKRIVSDIVKSKIESVSAGHREGKWLLSGKLVQDMLTKDKFDEFLTTVCYPHILTTAYEGAVIPEDDGPTHSRL
eukprot:CAMPEP_0172487728 /NCGR_PEP_ID=MMETSP1066-20121228/16924_1 /TAXON_ID=671091 /ORGANISM="Coscinodiscus wailesii, Strain CCMP2513" /LENGTH=578 /DNA_ID=CAMNT_0013254515 /DNA_START=202 /DNA_END=1938 /DNA_ORIENTATION=-